MTAPVGGGADEIREQLAEALPESLGPVGLRRRAIPALDVQGSVTGYGVALLDALLPTVRALIAAELRAAGSALHVDPLLRAADYASYVKGKLDDRAAALDGTP